MVAVNSRAYNSLAIANSILDEAERQGITVTPVQMQKLAYFTNGWHLEINNGNPLMSGNFKAWQFGPVLLVLYHEFKHFGSRIITERAENPFEENNPWVVTLSPQQSDLLSEVIGTYGNLSGPIMSKLTHKEGTPWYQTWNGGVGSGDEIPQELILEEFRRIREGQKKSV